MKPRSLLASLVLAPAALAIGCGTEAPPEDDIGSTNQALSTPLDEMPQNGLTPDGLASPYPLLHLLQTVWQHSLDDAGFALTLETPTSPSIASLFSTGNSADSYMREIVECALNSDRVVRATIDGAHFEWWGKFGLCDIGSPFGNWRTSGASVACRYMVSACSLARMNALGKHVPISMRVPNEIGEIPVDASKFHLADKVRVQTMRRDGTRAASAWQPDFVGICKRGGTVSLQRTPATTGQAVRVCTGIQACDPGPPEPMFPGSPRVYSGFLAEFAPGPEGVPISFTCPTMASTAPSGKPDRAYFSILVSPGTGGAPSLNPMLEPIFSSSTTYPAAERDVFTYQEGGFYGDLLPNPGAGFDAHACYSPLWRDGPSYESGRICALPDASARCFIRPDSCDQYCSGRSSAPDGAYYDCMSDVDTPRWTGVTVFLNDPSGISTDPVASAIVAVHDVCTPGASLVNGTTDVVTSVCAADPHCCSAVWDNTCVNEVRTIAGSQACGTAHCSHPVCTTGAALTNGCSPVVAKVCTVDPYCCNAAWDGICVGEVQTVANSQACACSHPGCTTGAALNNGCSPVVTSVCAADPFCCNTAWDSTCVQEIPTVVTHQECGCSHPVCIPGAALVNGCSPVVAQVCTADPYCCNTAWDSVCIQEVQTAAHSEECIPP